MALRQIMLDKQIREKKEALRTLEAREKELQQREAELEAAIEETTTEEETKTVEEEIDKFQGEKDEQDTEKKKLEEEIAELEEELRKAKEAPEKRGVKTPAPEQRKWKGETEMITRGIFKGRTVEERKQFVEREDTKEFLERIRALKGQTRGVSGAELTIPDVVLELLKDNLHRYSKLIGVIKLKPIGGTSRQTIAGTIPEAVWTEAVATLNELSISFNQVEMDGYMVGGFIPVPNTTLEDADINLAEEVIDGLGQAIGLAIDKVILYGKGIKMPMGIMTRLIQSAKPSDWGKNAPEWKDLHTSNIAKLGITGKTGAEFFSALILGLGAAKENYSNGEKFWCMNSNTKNTIMSKSVTFNAAGTITAMAINEMPVIGGKIIILPFMEDNDIIGGYGTLYLLAERKGNQFGVSEHAMFIQNTTVFKGTARYDGMPVIAEGFAAVNLGTTVVKAEMNFEPDKANTPQEPTT